MNHRHLFTALLCGLSPALFAQITFTNRTDLLTPAKHYSGVAIAVLDMNGDGHDDIVRMNQGFQLAIEYQTAPDKPFQHVEIFDIPNDGSQWGMCAADMDNNGFPDVMTSGFYDGVKVIKADNSGANFSTTVLDGPGTFAQCMNFADINNDGWLDAFVCHDDGEARIFLNDLAGNLVYAPQTIDLTTVPASDNSGNYGSVWSDIDNDGDLDLYIAKCRQGVNSPTDGRRINQLFLNNGDGTYTQDLTNASGLRIGAQSWTADFGDIDNDGDFDCFVTNHDVSSQLLENDGAGHFTDISTTSGIKDAIAGLPIQGVFKDFDNDGYIDILVAGSTHYLFRNNGDKTFSMVPILDNKPMESFGVGDLNSDGFLDIYAGYAEIYTDPSTTPDALWINAGNDHHFFGLNLQGVQSNRNAVGAKIVLHSALGTQVREVRSGESYGIMNSTQIHFGLGQATVDSVVVYWPSGAVDVLYQPALDQYMTLTEGGCSVAAVGIVANSGTTFCSGDSVELTGPDGFTYLWNTGSTSQSISVNAAGNFWVSVISSEGCAAVSNIIGVVVDPIEIPVISIAGDTVFCKGESVVLTASPASAYWWSTGETTPSITTTQPGIYGVTTQGLCAQFSSSPVQLTVLEPELPVVTGDTVWLNASASLTATGDELIWYDAPGGNVVFNGSTFETPQLSQTTTFWVANRDIFDMPNVFTGMPSHMGSNFAGQQTNGAVVFDCFSPFRLARTKVYTNKAGVRKIDLRDADGVVLQSVSVNIPVGETVIDLNLDIPVGTDLALTTDEDVNSQNLGTAGPQLRRADEGVEYPYDVPGYVSVKSSNFGANRYYYFFNWEVDFYARECLSEPVAVVAVVDSTITAAPVVLENEGLRLFPNPTGGSLQVEWENYTGGACLFTIKNTRGQLIRTRQFDQAAGKVQLNCDLTGLAKGLYWAEFTTESGVIRRKLVVQ